MRDFQPDFFSKSKPESSTFDSNLFLEITTILKKEFPGLSEIVKIEQIAGLNLNSNNIKVNTTNSSYILKTWGLPSTDRINQICSILLHINSQGVFAPTPILNYQDRFVMRHNQGFASIFKYIEGEIFQPEFSDLSAYLASIDKLFLALESYTGYENYSQIPDLNLIFDTLSAQISINTSRLQQEFTDEFDLLKSMAQQLLIDIEEFAKITNVNAMQFSHFDLHPKNILKLSNDDYAFLDFESCLYSDPNIAWGFTLIKILRQMIVASKGNLNPKIIGARALEEVNKLEFASRLQVQNLPTFGRIEIMRRLVLIIDQYENFNSTTWLSMLPIQIQILRESYLLFPRK